MTWPRPSACVIASAPPSTPTLVAFEWLKRARRPNRASCTSPCWGSVRSISAGRRTCCLGPAATVRTSERPGFHVLTREEMEAHRQFVSTQIAAIESSCVIAATAAPNDPSDLAMYLTDTFNPTVLDAAHISTGGHILISEDLYYRQIAKAAVGSNGVWLQAVFDFARAAGILANTRYAELGTNLAQRHHAHVAIDHVTLLAAFRSGATDDLAGFRALVAFLATPTAEMGSHIKVASRFLRLIWGDPFAPDLRRQRATSLLLDRLTRHKECSWTLALALLRSDARSSVRAYIDGWIVGHFLQAEAVAEAEAEVHAFNAVSEINRLKATPRGK